MPRRFSNIPPVGAGNERQVLTTAADVLGYITGQTQSKVQPLATTATNAQIIAKINELIARLQGTE